MRYKKTIQTVLLIIISFPVISFVLSQDPYGDVYPILFGKDSNFVAFYCNNDEAKQKQLYFSNIYSKSGKLIAERIPLDSIQIDYYNSQLNSREIEIITPKTKYVFHSATMRNMNYPYYFKYQNGIKPQKIIFPFDSQLGSILDVKISENYFILLSSPLFTPGYAYLSKMKIDSKKITKKIKVGMPGNGYPPKISKLIDYKNDYFIIWASDSNLHQFTLDKHTFKGNDIIIMKGNYVKSYFSAIILDSTMIIGYNESDSNRKSKLKFINKQL